MERSGIITLTTDFGPSSIYAGVLRGVIWGIYPPVRVADLTHAVRPQDVAQGAFLLAAAGGYYPPGTVHVGVVDPGVGTERPALAAALGGALYVAPDNGLLSEVWAALPEAQRARARIVELTEPRYWLDRVSPTFHGRDIFAPVAAHLAAGVALEALGQPRQEIVLLQQPQAQVGPAGALEGRIVHLDPFGNCVSNVTAAQLTELFGKRPLLVEVAGRQLAGLARTYGERRPGEALALIGSSGRLEIAVRDSSAAAELGIAVGDLIRVRAG